MHWKVSPSASIQTSPFGCTNTHGFKKIHFKCFRSIAHLWNLKELNSNHMYTCQFSMAWVLVFILIAHLALVVSNMLGWEGANLEFRSANSSAVGVFVTSDGFSIFHPLVGKGAWSSHRHTEGHKIPTNLTLGLRLLNDFYWFLACMVSSQYIIVRKTMQCLVSSSWHVNVVKNNVRQTVWLHICTTEKTQTDWSHNRQLK